MIIEIIRIESRNQEEVFKAFIDGNVANGSYEFTNPENGKDIICIFKNGILQSIK